MRIRLLASLIAAVTVTSSAAPASAASHNGLIEGYTKFMGCTLSDKTVRSMRLSGTTSAKKGAEAGWERVNRGIVYRERFEDREAESATEEGYSGRLFWRSNLNGFTNPVQGRAREVAASRAYVLSNNLSALDGETRPGKKAGEQIVRVTPPEGATIDLAFDEGGKLTGFVLFPDDDDERLTYVIDRYAELAPGKKIIADYHIGSTKIVATKTEANIALADNDLAPPAATASWTFGTSTGAPIERTERKVIVSATVNGVKGRFLFDTGASNIAFTSGFARRAGVKRLGGVTIATTVGGLAGHYGRVATITIDGSTLSNVIVATDLVLGDLDGLLGFDAAAASIVSVDFTTYRLSIYDPAAFKAPGGKWFPIPVDLANGTPNVIAKFGNGETGYLMIDSGNSADTSVGYALHGVVKGQQFLRSFTGAGSIMASQARCGYSDVVQVEGLRLHDSVVCFAQSGGKSGILGFGFLGRFNWLLDYPEAMMFLSKK